MSAGKNRPHGRTTLVLVHDGSFAGFLCAAAEMLNDGRNGARGECVVRGPGSPTSLFEERMEVARDDGRARNCWLRIARLRGTEALHTVLDAFRSDLGDADSACAAALCRLWREGRSCFDDLGDPDMLLVEKAAHRTAAEGHRMAGLLRFAELSDGSWYAAIAPDCDVLGSIAEHFAQRFAGMRWVIHDEKRGTAALHEPGAGWRMTGGFSIGNGGSIRARDDEAREALPLSAKERELRGEWVRYFEAVSIRERENPRQQAHGVPLKYRDRLPEFSGGGGEP